MIERIVLKNTKRLEELVLDKVSTPDFILGSVEWEPIKGTHHSYRYVNQIGESVSSTSLGARAITIEGWAVAQSEDEMDSRKSILNAFVNPQEEVELFYKEYVIKFLPDESVRYSVAYEENNDVFCKFRIEGTCHNPMFSDINETSKTFVATIPMFHFPLVLSKDLPEKGVVFGRRMESLIVSATNKGSVDIGMRIVFKANGTVVNPSLINVSTQEALFINKTLVADEEIQINTNIGERSVRGRVGLADFANYYMYRSLDSAWLKLYVGENLFRYEADAGIENLDVFVYFSNRFLEVQGCY